MIFRSVFIRILGAVIVSWLVMHFVFPEQYIRQTYSFLLQTETQLGYYGAFNFLSNLLHGGVALWDPYDQMPLTYLYGIGHVVPIDALFTGIIYLLTAKFFASPAEAFYFIHAKLFLLPDIFISSAGLYFLFCRFVKNRILIFLLLIVSGTFGVSSYHLGLNTANNYAFFPLLAHFILKFFEKPSITTALLGGLTMSVSVADYAEVALGNFYQGVHFFLIAAIIWFLIFRLSVLKSLSVRRVLSNIYHSIGKSIVTLVTVVLLLSPFVYLLIMTYHDYDFAHDTSRFAGVKLLDAKRYFTQFKGIEQHAPQNEFFSRIVDFKQNGWEYTWLFLGASILFFSLAGIFLSSDKRRYVFIFAALFFWLINSDRTTEGWSSWIHWLNALTNPFSFIVRSFHMTAAFLISYLLLPLMAIGIVEVFGLHKKKFSYVLLVRLAALIIVSLAVLWQITPLVSTEVLFATRLSFLVFLYLLIFPFMRMFPLQIRLLGSAGALLFLFGFDTFHLREYILRYSASHTIQSFVIPFPQNTQATAHVLDFQNPEILPLRRYIYTGKQRDGWIFGEANYFQGLYYHYSYYSKYFTPASQHKPRHKSFSAFSKDREVQQYVSSIKEMIVFADVAVADKPGILGEIVSGDLQRQVVTVDRDPQKGGFFSVSVPEMQPRPVSAKVERNEYKFSFRQGKKLVRKNADVYLFALPKEFPAYMATGVFTDDRDLIQVTIGDRVLTPEQGYLGGPWTFDVQNFATGMLAVGVPHGEYVTSDVIMRYPKTLFPSVSSIWKYTTDSLGFDYQAAKNGWLVLHYPYDTKWKVSVDGVPATFYRVNRSFMGIPLSQGSHKILIEYWPSNLLRIFLGISVILIFILPYTIVWIELNYYNKLKSTKSEIRDTTYLN